MIGGQAQKVGGIIILLRTAPMYNRSFPCMEATYPYAIETQRKARNAPSRGLWVTWAGSLWHKRAGVVTNDLNQSEHSIWGLSTNESSPLCCQVVEGEPECYERTVENIVEVPEETCSLEPTTECKNETIR